MKRIHNGLRLRRGLAAAGAAVLLTIGMVPLGAPPAAAVAGGAADQSRSFLVRLAIGDVRACSGVLVDTSWVLTAASCFAVNGIPPVAGAPALPTTATVGRTDLLGTGGEVVGVTSIVPRADRDVALAKLSRPVLTVAPAKLATTSAAVGDVLQVTGFGRTATEWAPNVAHTGAFAVRSVTGTTLAVAGQDPSAALCRGDAGGPALRGGSGNVQVVAISSASWQHGCLGSAETRTGAVEARVDDLGTWIRDNAGSCTAAVEEGFTSLYNGDTVPARPQWRLIGTGTTIDDRCEMWSTGSPLVNSYAAARMPAAYTMRLDWKAMTASADSGVYLFFGDLGGNPAAATTNGLEVQIKPSGTGSDATGAITGVAAPSTTAPQRPAGQWNTFELAVTEQRVVVKLNGVAVQDYAVTDPLKLFGASFLGLGGDTSTGGVRFRNLRLRSDPLRSTLKTGEQLTPGDSSLVSSDGRFRAPFQPDGNFVLYERNVRHLWAADKFGGNRLVNQPDGNLVLYNADGTPLWHTVTYGNGASTLTVQPDGNLVLTRDSDKKITWQSGTGNHVAPPPHPGQVTDHLSAGQALYRDDVALWSPHCSFRLTLQSSDGNLVLYPGARFGSGARWAAGALPTAAWATVQKDGNFVIYSSDNLPLWSTVTYGNGPSTLKMQDDGNLVLYRDSDGKPTWSSETYTTADQPGCQ